MVVSSRCCEATGVCAGVEQREAAGAIGRLDHAGREAGLADRSPPAGRRRCRASGSARRRAPASVSPKSAGAVAHLRQHRGGHAEQRQQLLVPDAAADVEQQRARGVGGVGRMHRAAGQPPEQEAVDRAEGEFARLRAPRARRARCRAARRSWCRRNRGRAAGRCAARTSGSWPAATSAAQCRRGAPVLPDDGAVDRRGRCARSQTSVVSRWLVMPIAAMSRGLEPGLGERLAAGREHAVPDVLRLVLDPARGRKMLRRIPAAPLATACRPASKTMARDEVVPWSMARMMALRGHDVGVPGPGRPADRGPAAETGRMRRARQGKASRSADRAAAKGSAWHCASRCCYARPEASSRALRPAPAAAPTSPRPAEGMDTWRSRTGRSATSRRGVRTGAMAASRSRSARCPSPACR